MAIEFFSSGEASLVQQIPFIEAWVEANPGNVSPQNVIRIRRTKKQTGYMLYTDCFGLMLFENSKTLKFLLEALNIWVTSGEGFQLFAAPKDVYPFYDLGVDKDKQATWLLTKGEYSWFVPTGLDSENAHITNPFLPQTQMTTRTKHKSATAKPI